MRLQEPRPISQRKGLKKNKEAEIGGVIGIGADPEIDRILAPKPSREARRKVLRVSAAFRLLASRMLEAALPQIRPTRRDAANVVENTNRVHATSQGSAGIAKKTVTRSQSVAKRSGTK